MPDITIQNLRVAPGAGPRVPTTWGAFPMSDFLLNDADHTAVSATSPYNGGTPFKTGALSANAPYYEAADFTLPSTTDSPDNPNGARWGLFVFDANGRLMFPVAGLESFALDHTDATQDVEDIRAYNLGGLPTLTPTDRTVDGNLTVGGTVTAQDFAGNGSLLTGVLGAGPGGSSSTGSHTFLADSDDNDPAAIADTQVGVVTVTRGHRDYFQMFKALITAVYAFASLPSAVTGALVRLSDNVKGFVYKTAAGVWSLLRREINALDFGVLNDGTGQSTANLQAALDAADASILAKTVYLPPGSYLFTSGTLIIPAGVSLVGSWHGDPSHSGALDVGLFQPDPDSDDGTTILIDTGSGISTGAFITQYANTTIKGISFYWPSQSQTAVTPTAYPFCIQFRGNTYTGFNQRVENCEMVNAYQGISARYGGRWKILDVTGQFLKTGIEVDYQVDKSEIVNFKNVLLWSNPFVAAPADNAFKWMNANGTGINVGKADALTIISPFIYGSNKGIAFHSSPIIDAALDATLTDFARAAGDFPGGVQWVDIIGGGVGDAGVYGLYFAGNPAGVSSSDFESRIRISGLDISSSLNSAGGTTYGVYFHTDYVGNVAITNSHFGPFNSDYCVYNVGAPKLSITNSIFHDWDVAAIFSNSSVTSPYPTHLTLGNNIYRKAAFLTLDLRDKIVGTDSGSLYTSSETQAFNFTSTLSFLLNGVRMSDGGTLTGLLGLTAAKFKSSPLGNVLIGPTTEIATTATANLLYMPTVNGAPTGAPAVETGKAPFVIDRSNGRIYAYFGGAWHYWNMTA